MRWKFAAIVLLFSGLAGCSTHPLPEDVTRKTTFDIVQKIRCEARQGIFDAGIDNHPDLSSSTIGFDFNFKITETSGLTDGSLSFMSPAHGGSLTVGLRGGVSKSRVNERIFRVVDNLYDLKRDQSCEPDRLRANFIYPMAGHIGMDEIVVTFAKLRGFTPALTKIKDTNNVLSDTLQFTTTLTAGITPTLKVDAGVGSLHLTNFTLNGDIGRTDVHTVNVAIARTAPSLKMFAAPAVERTGVISPFVVDGARTLTPSSASSGDSESSVINELDRLRYIDRLREFPLYQVIQ